MPGQRVTRAVLADVVDVAAAAGVRAPAVIVLGAVAAAEPARKQSHGTSSRHNGVVSEPIDQTLAGCVVLVTADRRSAELAAALGRRGAAIRHAPALSMVPHTDDAALLEGTRSLLAEPPDTVVVTTGIGFRGWIEAADAYGLAEPLVEMLRGTRLVARGPKARGAIQAAGLTADWVAESETSAEIAEVLLDEGVAGRDIAVQHHGAGADGLDEAFAAAGARVRSLIVYRWGPPPDAAVVEASVRSVAAGRGRRGRLHVRARCGRVVRGRRRRGRRPPDRAARTAGERRDGGGRPDHRQAAAGAGDRAARARPRTARVAGPRGGRSLRRASRRCRRSPVRCRCTAAPRCWTVGCSP